MVFKNKIIKKPLYVILSIVIILTVVAGMSVQSYFMYSNIRAEMINDIKHSSKITINSMTKNVSRSIESYAINEYDNFMLNEMGHKDFFAMVIEDYNMGKILGKDSFVSGKIRTTNDKVTDLDVKNEQHLDRLKNAYYIDEKKIIGKSGEQIGKLSIYSTDYLINIEKIQIIQRAIYQSLGISILLILTLLLSIKFIILQPITNIVKTISKTNRDGIPTDKIYFEGSTEVSILSSTINNMIDSISLSRQELESQRNKLLEQREVLHHQANHDALTGLANRVLLNDRLEQSIEKSKRTNSKVALLFIDLDHFKEINDSLGHDVGDDVLIEVTRRLNSTIRKEDTLARLGGDEFTIVIEDLRNGEDASLLARKILKIIELPINVGENQFFISSSIGISLFPDDGSLPVDLLKYADAAMYKAKDEGRNNFQYYSTEMTDLAFERVVMEASLRQALKKEEFVVFYQPQVDAKLNKLIGMEALVRWMHPSMGLIPPMKFISIAEATGLIIEIDRYVIRRSMLQISKWYKAGLTPGVLAINISVKHLQQKDFISFLEITMEETKCKPEWLELEVTESHVMTNPEEAIKILDSINKLGIELSVDDFGTGYSSLSYLKRLPVNKLKIDQSFVKDLPHDEEDIAISKAIIALSKSLNLNIIAEGVETKEQKEFMLKNGCNNIQGYYYSKPVAANEFEVILKNGLDTISS